MFSGVSFTYRYRRLCTPRKADTAIVEMLLRDSILEESKRTALSIAEGSSQSNRYVLLKLVFIVLNISLRKLSLWYH